MYKIEYLQFFNYKVEKATEAKGVGPSQPIQMIDIMVIISPCFVAISPFLLSKRGLLTGTNGERYPL